MVKENHMELTLIARSKRIKTVVEQDHYWYDPVQRKMLHGRGGRMDFYYHPQQKRMMPYIVNQEEWVNRNDYPEIKQWIKDNNSKFDLDMISDMPNRCITVQIPVSHFDVVQEDLYRHNIVSDWSELDRKKEKESDGDKKEMQWRR